jgi:hypothetical protein
MTFRSRQSRGTRSVCALFLARSFGVAPSRPFVRAEILHWKYWTPRDDYQEPRSFVIERGDKIVAHAAVWPAKAKVREDLRVVHALIEKKAKETDAVCELGAMGSTDESARAAISSGLRTATALTPVFFYRRPGGPSIYPDSFEMMDYHAISRPLWGPAYRTQPVCIWVVLRVAVAGSASWSSH